MKHTFDVLLLVCCCTSQRMSTISSPALVADENSPFLSFLSEALPTRHCIAMTHAEGRRISGVQGGRYTHHIFTYMSYLDCKLEALVRAGLI